MKTFYLKSILVWIVVISIQQAHLFAQAPNKMSYQAIIRDASKKLVANQTIGMQINIIQGSINGAVVYSETQRPTTNSNGLATIEIGDGTPITGEVEGIDWSNGPYFIKTETDPSGGINYTITGTSQLLSVPYAMYACKAGNGFSGDFTDLTNLPDFTKWDKDSTDNVLTSGNQTISGTKTFSGTVKADSLFLTKKTSIWEFNPHNIVVYGTNASDITINHYEWQSNISSSATGEKILLVFFDLPYQVLGCPQRIKSITLNYKCETSNVYIKGLYLRKSNLGTGTTLYSNSSVNLNSTSSDSYTINISNLSSATFTGKRVYMEMTVNYAATGTSNEIILYEFIVETY